MTQEITMGSLFSGSGGFELAGSIFGIRPIWASEIEPFPILVTTKNFPEMKHLGDINKLTIIWTTRVSIRSYWQPIRVPMNL